MQIGEAIREYRHETNQSQREVAEKLFVDRSLITKAEKGMKLSESHDSKIAKLHWKLALTIIDERSGGYISNILEDNPNMDLHPAALKEMLMKDLQEAWEALGDLMMVQHIDTKKRKEQAEKVWHEVRDVVEKGAIMQGVLEEIFELDRDQLVKKHEFEVKEGKR